MVLIQSRDKAYPVAAASLQSRSPLQHIAVYYITIILHYKYMNNYTYKYTYKYIIYIQMQIQMHMQIHYSLMRLVLPNTEELISRPFRGLYKIRLLLRDASDCIYIALGITSPCCLACTHCVLVQLHKYTMCYTLCALHIW